MNVLLVSPQPFYTERGTPIAVRLLAECLADEGHQVDLLCYPFGTEISYPRLRVIRCARVPGVAGVGIGWSAAKVFQDVALALKLATLSRRGQYDVVHAVEESVYPALALRPFHHARVVYDMDSSMSDQLVASMPWLRPLRPLLNACEKWSIGRADLVVPMCEELAERARAVRDAESVVVLHDVPVAGPAEPVEVENLRARSSGRPVALYVGNLESYQGIDLLMDAVTRLKADAHAPKTLVVGGSTQDVDRYRLLARDRDLESSIEFLGPRPLELLPALLAQADILLSPRVRGGNTPLKIYSYMSSSRPIVATRLSTHTQVLDDTTAILTAADPTSFAAGMRALANDPALRDRIGSAARDRVEASFSMDSFRARLRSAYSRIAGRHLAAVKDA